MKTSLCLLGAAMAAVVVPGIDRAFGQEPGKGESAKIPFEFAVLMSDYVSKRNRALAEFDRVYLEKFAALKTKYEQQKEPDAAAAAAVRNKIFQLQKEIERLEADTGGGFVLLEANYGSTEKNVDCLKLLLGQVRDDRLRITVKPAAIGLEGDPHFGVRKTLTIKYLWNDEVRTASARDGQLVDLPEADDSG